MPRNQAAQLVILVATNDTTTQGITIPEGTTALGVKAPALDAAATWKLQFYDPLGDTWLDPEQWDPTDGVLTVMSGLAASKLVVFLASLFCMDTFRLVTSAAQTANKTFGVFFR